MADNTETERILDNEKLFRYSGMVDSLRDAVDSLIQKSSTPVSVATCAMLAAQYNILRNRALSVLRADLAEEARELTVELDDTADHHAVYIAAVQLARYADVVHQSPRFMLAEKANEVSMRQIEGKIGEGDLGGIQAVLAGQPDEDDRPPAMNVGQYL